MKANLPMLPFLDFDGVLHPDRSSVDLYFCRLTLLEPWLRKRPQIEVVISSSWREAHPLDELREFALFHVWGMPRTRTPADLISELSLS